jgi:hypothetical protein
MKRKEPRPRTDEDVLNDSLAKLDRYRGLLAIDRDRLDDNLIEQGQLFSDVCDETALALFHRDKADQAVTLAEGEADERYRAVDPSETKKPPETKIKRDIDADEHVLRAKRTYLRWKLVVDRWFGLQKSFSQRASSMESLTQLYNAGYFTKQSGARAQPDVKQRAYDRTRDEIAAARRRSDG